MNKQKKYLAENNPDIVQEPAAVYLTTFKEKLDPANTDEQEIVLKKMLEIGLKQSEMDLGKPHEEVWAEMKLKHSFK